MAGYNVIHLALLAFSFTFNQDLLQTLQLATVGRSDEKFHHWIFHFSSNETL